MNHPMQRASTRVSLTSGRTAEEHKANAILQLHRARALLLLHLHLLFLLPSSCCELGERGSEECRQYHRENI